MFFGKDLDDDEDLIPLPGDKPPASSVPINLDRRPHKLDESTGVFERPPIPPPPRAPRVVVESTPPSEPPLPPPKAPASQRRHRARLTKWLTETDNPFVGYAKHEFWWQVHNLLAHPLLGLFPSVRTVRLHDWSSNHLNRLAQQRLSPVPTVANRRAWLEHNVLAHIAIGLYPSEKTFAYHDRTAAQMGVPGWV